MEPRSQQGRIRVGIVGASPARGWGTAAHLPALAHLPEFEVTAVSTTRLASAEETAAAWGVPRAFASTEELVASDEVDVVVVAVRVTGHAEIVRAALEAGKHVFSEWPLGVDHREAVELADLAAAKGVTHLIGLQGLLAPGVLFVRDLIAGGRIGRVDSVSVIATGGLGGSRVGQQMLYTVDRDAGATVLTITGGHILAALAGVLGELHDVSAVVANRQSQATVIETGQVVEVTSPDQVVVAGTLDDGVLASLCLQGAAPPGIGFQLRIVGSEGVLDIQPVQPGGSMHIADWIVHFIGPDGTVEDIAIPADRGGVPEGVPAGPPRNVAALYQELGRALAEGRPAYPGFDVAVRYHDVLETIQRAADTGVRQTLPEPTN